MVPRIEKTRLLAREWLLAQIDRGRTLAWMSDIGPHWCPEPFATWEGYARLWCQAIDWVAGDNATQSGQ